MRRITFIGVLLADTALSFTVVYPAVHEGGHDLAARLFGVEVTSAVWTLWGGHPHVSLGHTPDPALPWINAGGVFLPTLVGAALASIWIAAGRRLHRILSACLAVPSLILLAGNLGLIAEILTPSGFKHLRPLSQHLGFSGFASAAFQLLPALVSGILLSAMALKWRRLRKASETPLPPSGPEPAAETGPG